MASKKRIRLFPQASRTTRPRWRRRSPAERAGALKRGVDLYRSGYSIRAAATEAGVSREMLSTKLYGEIRPRRLLNQKQVLLAKRQLGTKTIRALAEELGVSRRTLRRELDKIGVPRHPSGRPRERGGQLQPKSEPDPQASEMWRLYQQGLSCRAVGHALGVSASTVSRKLNAAGHERR